MKGAEVEEKEKGDEVTGGEHAAGCVPAVVRLGAPACKSHKGGTGMGMRGRPEITATYHHPRMSEGSGSDRTEGRRRLTLKSCNLGRGR